MLRRVGRVVFGTAAALSLCSAVAVVYLWATSYPQRYGLLHHESVGNRPRVEAYGIDRGAFQYFQQVHAPEPDSTPDGWSFDDTTPGIKPAYTINGFAVWTIPGGPDRPMERYVVIPLWFVLLLLLVPPTWAVPLWVKWFRHWRATKPTGKRGFEPVTA